MDYGFDNVMLFINAEEYNHGHMSIEEAKPWVETIKKTKKILNENGISVSLNPWIEIGHLDRSRPLKENQRFTTMVDYEGKVLFVKDKENYSLKVPFEHLSTHTFILK